MSADSTNESGWDESSSFHDGFAEGSSKNEGSRGRNNSRKDVTNNQQKREKATITPLDRRAAQIRQVTEKKLGNLMLDKAETARKKKAKLFAKVNRYTSDLMQRKE